jgi:hypothetical protein
MCARPGSDGSMSYVGFLCVLRMVDMQLLLKGYVMLARGLWLPAGGILGRDYPRGRGRGAAYVAVNSHWWGVVRQTSKG